MGPTETDRQNVIVRRARPSDGPGIGLVHVVAWQIGYRGIVPDTHLAGLDPVDRGHRWADILEQSGAAPDPQRSSTIVAEVGGQIAGFASYGPYRASSDDRLPETDNTPPDGTGDLCELWAIYVGPDHWGTGVAQTLMARAIDDLRATRREPEVALWVLEANARGRRFYEKVGWAADGWTKTDEFAGTTLTELRYARRL